MKYDRDRLYRIETNTDFVWQPIASDEDLQQVVDAFGLPAGGRLSVVTKRNDRSRVYRLEVGNDTFMLRSVAAVDGAMTEQQCRVASAIPYGQIVKPFRTRGGTYTMATAAGRAWMAYAGRQGPLFDGAACPVEVVLGECVALLEALRVTEGALPPASTERVPVRRHRPSEWYALFAQLTDRTAALQLPERLSASSLALLVDNRSDVLDLVTRLATHCLLDVGLVHNDLHHANVVISDRMPFFLDVEDIAFEDRGIALAHAVFKLSRHTVFSGVHTADDVRKRVIPRALELLRSCPCGVSDRRDLFTYGSYRIISDLWTIVMAARRGDRGWLYDVDKKIHNLFELYDLTRD